MGNKETGNDLDVPAEGMPSDHPDSEKVERWNRNSRLRQEYLDASWELQCARQAGDAEAERAAAAKIEAIGNEFVAANRSLVSAARPFLQGQNWQDHEAAALLGLWESFVGTDPAVAGVVTRDDDGVVRAASGWKPDSGAAFSTLSRRHITGRAARSVALLDSKYQGLSYSTFQQIPVIKAARDKLTKELGHAPTDEQVAREADVTVATVRAVSTATPASLDAPVGEDDSTLGDVISNDSSFVDDQLADDVEDNLSALRQLSAVDMCVAALRFGLTGLPSSSVPEIAEIIGRSEGSVRGSYRRIRAQLLSE